MEITKASIGAHLVGLPPHTARGLHNLFNHLFDEIERLRGTKQEPAPEVTGDVLPPVVPLAAGNADPLPAELVLTDATVLPTAVDQFAPPAATETNADGADATANPDTTDAAADIPTPATLTQTEPDAAYAAGDESNLQPPPAA